MFSSIPDDLIHSLCKAKAVTVLTGAGVSAESGIPTFRDAMDGLWAQYDPMDLATPEAFARDPAEVTRWYDHRRQKCMAVRPNSGHYALVELERSLDEQGLSFTLITQNVDRLHQRAGSQAVVELHGSIWDWICTCCGEKKEEFGMLCTEYPPRCTCGGVCRPGVVWFGEMLPVVALELSFAALEKCDFFFSIGTSSLVQPASEFIQIAGRNRAKTVEINLEPTPATPWADWYIAGRSGEILPGLIERLSP